MSQVACFCRCPALVFLQCILNVSRVCPGAFLVELFNMTCVPMCPAVFWRTCPGCVLYVSIMCPGMRVGARLSCLYVNHFFGSLLKNHSVVFVAIPTSQRLRKLSEVVLCSRDLWLWCGGLNNYAQPGFGRSK